MHTHLLFVAFHVHSLSPYFLVANAAVLLDRSHGCITQGWSG